MRRILFIGLVLCFLAGPVFAIDYGTTRQASGVDTDVDIIKIGGTATDTDAGYTTAGTLRTIEATDSTVVRALDAIEDWDDSDYCNVNMNIAGTDVAGGAGQSTAQTIQTIEATDSTVVKNLDIMKDWDDGDYCNVNVNVAGTDMAGGAGDISAQTIRTVEASDSTVTMNIKVAAASLDIIDDWDDANLANVNINIAGTDVDGNSGNKSAQTQRVIEADDSGVTVSLALLDDVVGATDSTVASKAAYTAGRASSTVQGAVDDGDLVPSWHDLYGRQVNYSANMAEGSTDTSPVSRGPITSGYSQIIDVTLDNDPDSATSSTVFVGDKTKVTFYLASDITVTDGTPTVEYRFFVSPDNSTWIDLECLYDKNGTDAPVSTISHNADDEETAWIPIGSCYEYIKVFAVGLDTDANDTVAVDVWLGWSKN